MMIKNFAISKSLLREYTVIGRHTVRNYTGNTFVSPQGQV